MGWGRQAMKTFATVMNMLPPVPTSYNRIVDLFHGAYEKLHVEANDKEQEEGEAY